MSRSPAVYSKDLDHNEVMSIADSVEELTDLGVHLNAAHTVSHREVALLHPQRVREDQLH